MVDSISNSGGAPGIKRTGEDLAARLKGAKAGPSAPAQTATGAGESVQISATAVSVPKELNQPPIELALVTKLQDEIAAGNYPIDLDAITESLFESYLELNN